MARTLTVSVATTELVEVCRLAGKEVERRRAAAEKEGDPKAFIEARRQSQMLKRLLMTAVGRVEGGVQVSSGDSIDA